MEPQEDEELKIGNQKEQERTTEGEYYCDYSSNEGDQILEGIKFKNS